MVKLQDQDHILRDITAPSNALVFHLKSEKVSGVLYLVFNEHVDIYRTRENRAFHYKPL